MEERTQPKQNNAIKLWHLLSREIKAKLLFFIYLYPYINLLHKNYINYVLGSIAFFRPKHDGA